MNKMNLSHIGAGSFLLTHDLICGNLEVNDGPLKNVLWSYFSLVVLSIFPDLGNN